MADQHAAGGMRMLPGGTFTMGSDKFSPEEAPLRRVQADTFWIDETPVTNVQFARFVKATGHVTVAEIAPDPRDYPGMLPDMDQAGSLVFHKTAGPVDMADAGKWWHFTFGACWKHPFGPDSTLDGLEDHPVVHVAYADAYAYAKWAGKDLPTEAEFEYAARGGLEGKKGPCCAMNNPRGARLKDSFDPSQPGVRIGRKVIKDGSHLCAANYCQRYRPAARHPEMVDTATTHIEFRCVIRSPG